MPSYKICNAHLAVIKSHLSGTYNLFIIIGTYYYVNITMTSSLCYFIMLFQLHIETMGNTIFRPFVKDLDPQKVNTVIYFLNENQEYKLV